MKKVLLLFTALCVLFAFLSIGNAQITKIKDIQYTTEAGGDSPLKGQTVTISGIVTGESYAFDGEFYFVQDSVGAWSGIKVYDSDHPVAYGDSVTLSGTVSEFYGLTEITDVTSFEISDSLKTMPPIMVSTGEIATDSSMAEAYEGVLVKVQNVFITNPDLGHGEWEVDDGSGPCVVDDAAEYYFNPADYDSVKSITGILDYSFGNTKIEPRLAYDIVESGEFTRFQRIQQVRYSDLMRAPYDVSSDTSYMSGDTVTVTGVVTMPTGLSYAGEGIKFIFGAPEGGPWSAILSYHPDSTAYPTLLEGDVIKMTGYIGEFSTGPSNMTEFWITSPIDLLDFGQELPPVDTINTGVLRWPTTAEQWGNVIVAVKNAVVKDLDLQYELFSVDDGTGELLIGTNSDSIPAAGEYEDPPQGTIVESIRGWVYHHYGSYADSTTYKLEPLYKDDIVLGAGPPDVKNISRDPAIPTSTDDVNVTADVMTNLTVDTVEIVYNVDGSGFQSVGMSNTSGDQYQGTIPAQSQGSFVSYFVKATDAQDQTTMVPSDTSVSMFGYPVTDGALTISDLQYSPWELADSPFEGVEVEVSGIVTTDTAMNNNYGAYAIQDQSGTWNGIFIFGAQKELTFGDEVTVYGTVTDYNPDWHYKWDNNTSILVDSLNIEATDQTLPDFTVLPTGDLGQDSEQAEEYEGTLVRIENATVTSINEHDVTLDDGSGPCLIDGDGLVDGDNDPNPYFYINQSEGYLAAWGDTLRVGDVLDFTQGVFTFSFGTYKIELRNSEDMGTVTDVNENPPTYPLTYNLEQNFPNPFNPETRIYFSIPKSSTVKIVIYNSLGQQVRTLIDANYTQGRHVVNWDGKDRNGELVPSGLYFYRMKAGDYIALKKMMLLK